MYWLFMNDPLPATSLLNASFGNPRGSNRPANCTDNDSPGASGGVKRYNRTPPLGSSRISVASRLAASARAAPACATPRALTATVSESSARPELVRAVYRSVGIGADPGYEMK